MKIFKKYNGQDTTWTASNIAILYKQLRSKYKYTGPIGIKVDDGGVGGGVVDQLRSYARTEPAVWQDSHLLPVNFGQPISHRYYVDSTTYMMGVVKDLIASV